MYYKVVNAKRTAKVDAPSMEEAAAQFLKIPIERLYEMPWAPQAAMFGVCAENLEHTFERIAVFEIEKDGEEKLLAREAAICAEEME